MTEFNYFSLADAQQAQGVVVVIDVLRAFTTAAYAFNAGASLIFPVQTVAEAKKLRVRLRGALLMGEVDGTKPQCFDLSNSPAEISMFDLSGKVLIQRTSAGTQGIYSVEQPKRMLATSFVVARATANYLRQLNPNYVSFIITGESLERDGDEDRACGEYIQGIIRGTQPDPRPYLNRVMSSTVGQDFTQGTLDYLLVKDVQMSMDLNRFDFYLPIGVEKGHLVIKSEKSP